MSLHCCCFPVSLLFSHIFPFIFILFSLWMSNSLSMMQAVNSSRSTFFSRPSVMLYVKSMGLPFSMVFPQGNSSSSHHPLKILPRKAYTFGSSGHPQFLSKTFQWPAFLCSILLFKDSYPSGPHLYLPLFCLKLPIFPKPYV